MLVNLQFKGRIRYKFWIRLTRSGCATLLFRLSLLPGITLRLFSDPHIQDNRILRAAQVSLLQIVHSLS